MTRRYMSKARAQAGSSAGVARTRRLSSGTQEPQLVPHCRLALQRGQALRRRCPRSWPAGLGDGLVGHVEAGADLLALGLHGHRRLGAGHEQQAAVGVGGQLVLQQRLEPGLGARVAGQQEAVELRDLAHAHQAHGAVLAQAFVGVAQGIRGVQAEQRFDLLRSGPGRALRGRRRGTARRCVRGRRARRSQTGNVRHEFAQALAARSARRLSGSQAMASSVQGSSALSTLTAACLSSGCLEVGQ